MGGPSGKFYDRDVSDRSSRTSSGTSQVSEEAMSRSRVDASLLPKGRELVCNAKSPLVYAFDVTGSMGNLPKIIYDKMPMIAGQLVEQGYLDDPMISIAAVGDIESDLAPIQIADFSLIRALDTWLQKIWLEGNGGGQAKESYEFTAYFYARMFKMPKAVTPFFLFTGDEGFREELLVNDLKAHFGGEHQKVSAFTIFEELKKKFFGNVYLIHRKYERSENASIVRQWQEALGKERVIDLPEDLAIADLTLGLFAVTVGGRTLKDYLKEMKEREQTEDRIKKVGKALEVVASLAKSKPADADEEKNSAADDDDDNKPTKSDKPKPTDKKKKPGGKKPGRF